METSWLCEDAGDGVVVDSLIGVLCARPLLFELDRWDVAERNEETLMVPPVDPSQGRQFDVVDVAPRAAC
jgi:hypothetical protein